MTPDEIKMLRWIERGTVCVKKPYDQMELLQKVAQIVDPSVENFITMMNARQKKKLVRMYLDSIDITMDDPAF